MSKKIEKAKVIIEGMFGDTRVEVIYEGSEKYEVLFSFYPDEIMFSESELIGLTREEALALKGKKDRAYLTA